MSLYGLAPRSPTDRGRSNHRITTHPSTIDLPIHRPRIARPIFTSHDPSCTPHPYHRRYDPRARVMRREWRVIASRARRSSATRRFVCVLTRRLIGVYSRERCVVVARASRSSSSSVVASPCPRRPNGSTTRVRRRQKHYGARSVGRVRSSRARGRRRRMGRRREGREGRDSCVVTRDSRGRVIHRPRRRHRHHESFDISRKWRPLG